MGSGQRERTALYRIRGEADLLKAVRIQLHGLQERQVLEPDRSQPPTAVDADPGEWWRDMASSYGAKLADWEP